MCAIKDEGNKANKLPQCLQIRMQTVRIVQAKNARNRASKFQQCL